MEQTEQKIEWEETAASFDDKIRVFEERGRQLSQKVEEQRRGLQAFKNLGKELEELTKENVKEEREIETLKKMTEDCESKIKAILEKLKLSCMCLFFYSLSA